mmetsp:Transcript_68353/g.110984  ORF Transcript_68353/g.110984 Transcript_68353/m.110984 type:complete len:104 (+) Transcript_68353:184-495(+)
MDCLTANTWVNDEVINAYFCLLTLRSHMRWEKYLVTSKTIKDIDEDEGVAPARCACFNSSLYVHLRDTDYSYQKVRRWSKGKELDKMDMIVAPINISNAHWVL